MKGWIKILLFIVPYLIIVGIFQLIGFYFAEINFKDINETKTIIEHLIISLCSLIGTFLVIFIFMKFIDKESFYKVGFKKRIKKNFLKGVLYGFILITISFLTLIVFNQVYPILSSNLISINILYVFLLCLSVATAEEILLRGYILKNLIQSFNVKTALIISSLLFSIMHLANPNINIIGFINIFGAGLLLGVCYIKTNSLWMPIGLHFSWNFFQTVYGFNVSGQKLYSLFEIKINEANFFNGGSFGIEGSIIASILQIGLILFLYLSPRSTKSPDFET